MRTRKPEKHMIFEVRGSIEVEELMHMVIDDAKEIVIGLVCPNGDAWKLQYSPWSVARDDEWTLTWIGASYIGDMKEAYRGNDWREVIRYMNSNYAGGRWSR